MSSIEYNDTPAAILNLSRSFFKSSKNSDPLSNDGSIIFFIPSKSMISFANSLILGLVTSNGIPIYPDSLNASLEKSNSLERLFYNF